MFRLLKGTKDTVVDSIILLDGYTVDDVLLFVSLHAFSKELNQDNHFAFALSAVILVKVSKYGLFLFIYVLSVDIFDAAHLSGKIQILSTCLLNHLGGSRVVLACLY